MLRSVPFTLPSNLSLDFMKANTKRINNEFRTWRDKLAKRGCTCRLRGLDLADNYLSVDVYSSRYGTHIGEFPTPRIAYNTIFGLC